MEREILYDNKWIQLCKIDDYIFSHEKRCNGQIVAVLPFMKNPFRYLARMEATPCIENDELRFCSITGGVEKGDIKGTAIMELREEAGVVAKEAELIDLGTVYPSKSQDTVVHLFGVDISNKEIGEAKGDGSRHETDAYCVVTSDVQKLAFCKDPLNVVMFTRLVSLSLI